MSKDETSSFTTPSSTCGRRPGDDFGRELTLERGDDPLSTLRRIMREISARFEYKPHSTRVDSPIDEALEARRGVCQDFAHIFIALARPLGIPTRYVSGYLYRDAASHDRSTDGATHAWVEAFLPEIGWIGRDYPDVPLTRGVYKGVTAVRSELGGAGRTVAVAAVLRRGAVHAVDVTRSRRGDAEARRATGSAATVEIRSCLFCAIGDAPAR